MADRIGVAVVWKENHQVGIRLQGVFSVAVREERPLRRELRIGGDRLDRRVEQSRGIEQGRAVTQKRRAALAETLGGIAARLR